MNRRIALWSLRLVVEALPPPRRSWGEAMRAELDHVDHDGEALVFALGCLAAALGERLRSITGIQGARLAGAAVAIGLAAFHLNCAADGVRIVTGGVDPFVVTLSKAGHHAAAEHWRTMTPLLTLGLGALGIAELLVGLFAIRAAPAAFARSLAAVAVITLVDGAMVFSVIGYTAGLKTFLAVMGLQAAGSLLLWRFAIRSSTITTRNVDVR